MRLRHGLRRSGGHPDSGVGQRDRMLDRGFEHVIAGSMGRIEKVRHRALFSAMWLEAIRTLTRRRARRAPTRIASAAPKALNAGKITGRSVRMRAV